MHILFLSKRQYMGKDLLDDSYGRFYEIPAELTHLGHQVTGFCLSYRSKDEGHLKGPEIDSTSVDWYSWNLGRLILPGGTRYLKHLHQTISNIKPDLIVANSDAIHVINGIRLAHRFSLPCVVDLYDNFESYGLTRLPGVMSRFRKAVSLADGVTCVSVLLKEYIMNKYHPSGPVKTINNGIPLHLFNKKNRHDCRKKLGLPRDVLIIGTAGALGTSRGIDVLFKAFQNLHSRNPLIHLALAGQIERGTTLPRGKHIHYLGNLNYEEVPVFLNALDIGVICNRDSSFGRYCFPQKAYEMIACGIPVAAVEVGVMKALLISTPGCLFKPNNFQSLVEIINKQLEEPCIPEIEVSTWPELAIEFDSFLKEVMKKQKY